MQPNQPIPPTPLPALPHSWSELTWQQLCDCWQVKLRYGGNPDVARAAALIALLQCKIQKSKFKIENDEQTGERLFRMSPSSRDCPDRICTAREIAHHAGTALKWYDFPYGDPGEKEQQDESGNVVKERREGVRGYVSNMKDAMILPLTETEVGGLPFALPQAACSNLTWEQYRALQLLTPQLFADGITEEQTLDLQAQFLAHCLVPAQDAAQTADKFGAKHVFKYDSLRAERTVPFWKMQMPSCPTLFHICFQVYQTALTYYETVYPLLFGGGGKRDPLQDALTGEAATIDAIMMKAHYASQQEVYDTNLPFILDILNTMAKEAKEIEKMNAKIKKK